jgi:hypothetical protein
VLVHPADRRLCGDLALYPVVWLLSPEGWGWVGSTMEVSLFMTLDLLAIVGFGSHWRCRPTPQLSGGEPIQPASCCAQKRLIRSRTPPNPTRHGNTEHRASRLARCSFEGSATGVDWVVNAPFARPLCLLTVFWR